MKNSISSLTFYLVLSCLIIGYYDVAHAQTPVDSTGYFYKLALNPTNDSDLQSAYNFFLKHKEKSLAEKDLKAAVYDLSMLSIIQKEIGFYHDSEASAIDAISLLDQMEETDYTRDTKISLYNELGKINRALMEYDRALTFYNKAYKIAKRAEHLGIITNNRGTIYLDQKDYQSALTEFQKAYDISIKIKVDREIARNLDNLGYVKAKLNRVDALTNLKTALEKRLALNDSDGLYISYKHLFEFYNDRNDHENARLYLNKAIAIANQLDNDSYQLDILSEYVNLNSDSLVTAYKVLNDERILENRLEENKYASKKYDYTKTELEAERNKIQKERYQLLGVFIIIVAFLSYFLLKTRHKKDKIQQVFKTETRISKKIHDELANDMSNIMNYVENELETSEENKTKLLNTLQDVYVRTRDISTETGSIDFVNFPDSLKYLLIQHNKPNVKIIMNDVNTIDWHRISDHKKLAVYRALQELMVNMKKHSQAHLVTVVFKKQKNKNEIWYTDDGIGTTIEKINQSGLSNAEFRMKEIGGKLTFETSQGNGFKAIISFNS